jgi:polyisoprenyl-phosphate glycosyltransferase
MISVIIPAFNEEKTIGQIVSLCKKSHLFQQIIVVDDGSTDKTSQIAQKSGAQVIKLPKNQGKGQALAAGIQKSKGEIFLFLDADLLNLKTDHLFELAKPVLAGELDLNLGVIDHGLFLNWFMKDFSAPLAGVRIFKKELWFLLPEKYKKGYLADAALVFFAKKAKFKVSSLILKGVGHLQKEKKYGFLRGFGRRLLMIGQVIETHFLLRIDFYFAKNRFLLL